MKPDHVYLSHMRDAIAKIERYLAGTDYDTSAFHASGTHPIL
jgi:uncharacterized protein with HEPN domain